MVRIWLMSNLHPSVLLWIVLLAAGVFFFCFIVMLIVAMWARRVVRNLDSRVQQLENDFQRYETNLLSIQGALKAISQDVMVQSQTQERVDQALAHLSERQTELRLRDSENHLYEQAIQMVREGCRRAEVQRRCALTNAEVDLLFSLHGHGLAGNKT